MKALVLSGGASFGAYQVGVRQALEQAGWQPDFIVGVSIGAVNAYAFSRGADHEELVALWRDLPHEIAGSQPAPALPWRRDVQLFRAWLEQVVRRFESRPPVCPMQALLLEAPSLRVHTIEGRHTERRHLNAACALPGILAPVRIDRRWMIDCGVVRNLPLAEAIAAGADEIVTVDLLANHAIPLVPLLRKSLMHARDVVYGECSEPPLKPDGPKLIRVEHPGPLGSLLDAFRFDRERSAALIELGRNDALQALRQASVLDPHGASTLSP